MYCQMYNAEIVEARNIDEILSLSDQSTRKRRSCLVTKITIMKDKKKLILKKKKLTKKKLVLTI